MLTLFGFNCSLTKITYPIMTHKEKTERFQYSIRSQRTRDKHNFNGLFNRGEVYCRKELQKEKETQKKCKEKDAIDSSNRDIILGKQLARFYEEKEMNEEKERIENICSVK